MDHTGGLDLTNISVPLLCSCCSYPFAPCTAEMLVHVTVSMQGFNARADMCYKGSVSHLVPSSNIHFFLIILLQYPYLHVQCTIYMHVCVRTVYVCVVWVWCMVGVVCGALLSFLFSQQEDGMDGEYQPKLDGEEDSDEASDDWEAEKDQGEAEKDHGGSGEEEEGERRRKQGGGGRSASSRYNKEISMLHRRTLVKEM